MSLRETGRSFVLLFARIVVGGLFLYTGQHALRNVSGYAQSIAGAGYPAPKVLAYLAILAQFVGGASVVLGALTGWGCLALAAFILPATWSFHVPAARAGDFRHAVDMFRNLGVAAALVLLAMAGPGGASVDRRVLKRGGQ